MIRTYRLFLLLFPARFRREHGAEMERMLDAMRRDRHRLVRGRRDSALAFWSRAFADLISQAAQARFGAPNTATAESTTLSRSRNFMDTLIADIRYALGSLLRSPGFTAIAVVTLALGIGATTSVFSVADAVILRPLPYPEPERLVQVFDNDETTGDDRDTFTGADFLDWQAGSSSFEELAAFRTLTWTLTGNEYPRRLMGASVTPNFFTVLGVEPQIGRAFSPATDPPGGNLTVVIGHDLWQGQFGGDPAALGKSLLLNGEPFTVVGVMPPGFGFPPRSDGALELWTAARSRVPDPPFAFESDPAEDRRGGYLRGIGRLADDVRITDAQAEMTLIAERLEAEYPDLRANTGIAVVPLHEAISGDVRPLLYMLLGAVGFVLLIACTNVANLFLAKASRREQEIALRKALGASNLRIVRQLLTESTVLASMGGILGVLLAVYGTDALVALAPNGLPGVNDAAIDLRVMVFASLTVLGAGLLFGSAPAARLVDQDLQRAVREGSGGLAASRRHRRLGRALIVTEVALSLLLVIGAGLMVRTFLELTAVDPGFDPSNTLVANVTLPDSKYQEDHQIVGFYDAVLDKLRSVPGVESAGSVLTLPMRWNIRGTLRISIEGRVYGANEETLAGVQYLSPGYFRTLRIPLVRGRLLSESDHADAPPVVLVNEAFVATYWPDEDPLGKRITWSDPDDEDAEWSTVVGVVADTRLDGLDAAAMPETYETYAQAAMGFTTFVVRSTSNPADLADAVRAAVLEVDPEQPISGISTLDDVLAGSLGSRRFNMLLLGSFAAAALVMAAVGLYGVLSLSVAQRTREIGLRRALGAQPGGVVRMVVGEGFSLALVSMVIGGVAGIGLSRFISSQVYGISALDPLTYVGGGLLVAAVALAACLVPARRAAKTDPMVALRRS